jgi:hypothetical protein
VNQSRPTDLITYPARFEDREFLGNPEKSIATHSSRVAVGYTQHDLRTENSLVIRKKIHCYTLKRVPVV